jgi:hypothetical protein
MVRAVKAFGDGSCDGLGAPSVNWVLDEYGFVGDNNLDRVTPFLGARPARCLEAVQQGMLAGMDTAGAVGRETLMF